MYLLDDLRERFKARPLALGGGRDEAGICASVVKILSASSIVLGSGVALAPRWVLTAAHLFRVPQTLVRVQTARGRSHARVRAIHWRTRAYRYDRADQWPEFAMRAGGVLDALVLLELDGDLDLQGRPAMLPGEFRLQPGQSLFVVGFGQDEEGHYDAEGVPRFAQMIYGGTDSNFDYRGVALRDNSVMAAGMPSSDDSGGPVYVCNWANLEFRQLAGIHSSRGRRHGADGEPIEPPEFFARFIPLTKNKEKWINQTMKDNATPPDADLLPPKPRGTSARAFCLRNQHDCWTLGSPEELDATWHLYAVSGKPLALFACDRVVIGKDADGQRRMRIHACGESEPTWVVTLGPQTGDAKVSNAWLEGPGKRVKGAALEGHFYVYRRTDGSKIVTDAQGRSQVVPCRRLHIDFYVPKSSHVRPQKTVEYGWVGGEIAVPVACDRCAINQSDESIIRGEFEDDQDDEGDGYED